MSNFGKLENTSELGSGQCPPAPPPDQLEIRNIDTDQLTSWPADAGQHTAAAAGHGGITIRRGSAGPRTLGRSPPTSASWTQCTESASILELSGNLRKRVILGHRRKDDNRQPILLTKILRAACRFTVSWFNRLDIVIVNVLERFQLWKLHEGSLTALIATVST